MEKPGFWLLNSDYPQKEMVELFTLTDDEINFISAKTKKTRDTSKLGLAVLLKSFQYLGRTIQPQEINSTIVSHIAKCLALNSKPDLSDYSNSTRKNHIDKVREYLQINTNKNERQ